jgi:hypothetical protein
VSQQRGFGYNGTEPTGSTQPDDGHDGMQQRVKMSRMLKMVSNRRSSRFRALAEFATHSGVREICMLRSTWRGMETSLRFD